MAELTNRFRAPSRDSASYSARRTISSARSFRVQRARPAGGSEHATATRNVSSRPVRLRLGPSPGTSLNAVSRPPSTYRRLVRNTVDVPTPTVAAIATSPVHPRVGGEHPVAIGVDLGNGGSSPRGRGTRLDHAGNCLRHRFIPAWAGNTISVDRCVVVNSVHPRVGGEHLFSVPCPAPLCGSSPCGRGTRPVPVGELAGLRFIPAWAGNTWAVCRALTLSSGPPVHPRVGGEHIPVHGGVRYVRGLGSSPRGRGTHDSDEALSLGLRGSGSSPRGRGTQGGRRRSYTSRGFGSSPRGRGTRFT